MPTGSAPRIDILCVVGPRNFKYTFMLNFLKNIFNLMDLWPFEKVTLFWHTLYIDKRSSLVRFGTAFMK